MSSVGGVAAQHLLSYIERIERLEEEKAGIAADIKDVKAEAKGNGYDIKTINEILKQRKLTAEERAEREALLDLYKAALGMLGDTPLGAAAISRLQPPKPPAPPPAPDDADPESPAAEPPPPPISREDAKAQGNQAAQAGQPITANPFPAHDQNRAAWDEGWCQATGSNGMEIPAAWQRRKKPKPGQPHPKPPEGKPGEAA